MTDKSYFKGLSPIEILSLERIAERLAYFHEQLHLLHWKTTSYARHMALGGIYEFVQGFKDGVMEKLMGYTGQRVGSFKIPPISDNVDEEMVIEELLDFSDKLVSWADENGYQDVANLGQSLSGEAAKTKYLFTLS